MVSLTYGHGYMFDGDTVTGWTEDAGLGANGAFSIDNNDYFLLENTGGAVDYFVDNDVDIDIAANTFPSFLCRYKTTGSTKAQIILEWDDTNTQTILSESSSTTWTTATGTLTANKQLDHVRFYANDATGYVYYDFVLIYTGTFTFPFVSNGTDMTGINRNPRLEIPGSVTDHPQQIGSKDVQFLLRGGMDTGTGWRGSSGTGAYGLQLYKLLHDTYNDLWEWYIEDSTYGPKLKVSIDEFRISPNFAATGNVRDWHMLLTEYSLGDKSNEEYYERFGLKTS